MAPAKPRTGRTMIAVDNALYERLKALAARNRRPVQWEAAIGLEAHVNANAGDAPHDQQR